MYRELLVGCGSSKVKYIVTDGDSGWHNLTTLDFNVEHKPDLVADLEHLPLPFKNEVFNEIHAYEVLEHTGTQGDWRFFFDQFTEFHRILKPGGTFFITTPRYDSMWAWGDPSHKRVINTGSVVFLDQQEYERQVGITPMTDYRFYYKVSFKVLHSNTANDRHEFVLRKS